KGDKSCAISSSGYWAYRLACLSCCTFLESYKNEECPGIINTHTDEERNKYRLLRLPHLDTSLVRARLHHVFAEGKVSTRGNGPLPCRDGLVNHVIQLVNCSFLSQQGGRA